MQRQELWSGGQERCSDCLSGNPFPLLGLHSVIFKWKGHISVTSDSWTLRLVQLEDTISLVATQSCFIVERGRSFDQFPQKAFSSFSDLSIQSHCYLFLYRNHFCLLSPDHSSLIWSKLPLQSLMNWTSSNLLQNFRNQKPVKWSDRDRHVTFWKTPRSAIITFGGVF